MMKAFILLLLCLLSVSLANEANRARIHKRNVLTLHETVATANISYFLQKIDHFALDTGGNYTFPQRYFVNDEYYGGNGYPVFLVIGGEGEMDSGDVTSNFPVTLAQEYRAAVVGLEHRFYGASNPYLSLNSYYLQFLTVEQSLADIAYFREEMSSVYLNASWIVFGCSYSGALSSWFRSKYPQLAQGSLSASSPVLAELSFYQYDEIISSSLGEKCSNAIRNATQEIETLLQSSSDIKELFQCSEISDNVGFLYALADMIAFVVQYNTSYGMIPHVCNTFETSSNATDAYIQVAHYLYNRTRGSCSDYDISNIDISSYNSSQTSENMIQWMWQSCSQLGYFQTAPTNNSLRSTQITAEWHLQLCQKTYGSAVKPTISETNTQFGGKNIVGSNIIYTNGALDPWKVLSVTSSSNPTVPSVVVDNQAHCAGWYKPNNATDSEAIESVHAIVKSFVGVFVKPSCSCNNKGVCTISTDSNGLAQSVCACFSGYGGSDCNTKMTTAPSSPSVPWWSLLVVGVICFVIAIAIGIFIGTRRARAMYQPVR